MEQAFLWKYALSEYTPDIFNGNGNVIAYLGRYANRIAVTNARIISVDSDSVTFKAKDYKTGTTKNVAISCVEFIRRFMMHVSSFMLSKNTLLRFSKQLGTTMNNRILSN